MKKQTIIVTGATSGIGKEAASVFLRNGDNVVLNSPLSEKLNQLYRELGGGENISLVHGNPGDRITSIKLLATAVAKFGSADILVNNPDVFATKKFLQADEIYFDRFVETNLKGTFFVTQGIIPQMLQQGHGIVINIDMPWLSNVSATASNTEMLAIKGAADPLTSQLAATYGKNNISFNVITLGTVQKSMSGDTEDGIAGMFLPNGVNDAKNIARMIYAIAKRNF